MLRGPDAKSPQSKVTPADKFVLTPLVLFAASPGTITGVITLSTTYSPLELLVTSLIAVGVAAPLLSCFFEALAAKGKCNARCLGAGKETFKRNRPGIVVCPQTVEQSRQFRGSPRLAAA